MFLAQSLSLLSYDELITSFLLVEELLDYIFVSMKKIDGFMEECEEMKFIINKYFLLFMLK